MYSTNEKLALFATVCVPVRLFISSMPTSNWTKKNKKNKWIVFLFLMTIGVYFIFKHQTSKETFFGSEKYWSGLNHGSVFILASALMFVSPKYASYVLYADVVYGIFTVIGQYKS